MCLPFPACPPIKRLPLIEMDLKELSQDKEKVLASWNEILFQYEGGM